MPIYTYRCTLCKEETQVEHTMVESPMITCPLCLGLCDRVVVEAPTVRQKSKHPQPEPVIASNSKTEGAAVQTKDPYGYKGCAMCLRGDAHSH